MKTNIALVGYMGTGKTTVGKALAKKLKKEFVEMDQVIEQKAHKPIPQIFAEEGEIAFRELEMAVAKSLAKESNTVFSCGGGIVLNKLNLDYLRQSSEIILLLATEEVIVSRIMKDGQAKRPVIDKPDPLGEIRKVLQFRRPFYEAATEKRIDTSNKTVDQIVVEIISISK